MHHEQIPSVEVSFFELDFNKLDRSQILNLLESREQHRVDFQNKVKDADPLELNSKINLLHLADEQHDFAKLQIIADEMLSKFRDLKLMDSAIASASLRDFELIVGVCVKHGIHISQLNDDLEGALISCGTLAKTVPRGTIFSYTLLNPEGINRRTHTRNPVELKLIELIHHGSQGLEYAIDALYVVSKLDSDEKLPISVELINQACTKIEPMSECMVETIKHVGVQFFTYELGQYVHAMEIGGQQVDGVNPARVPMMVLDHLLFGFDMLGEGNLYAAYFNSRKRYLQKDMRDILDSFSGPTIFRKCQSLDCEENMGGYDFLKAVRDIALSCRKFRYPHKKLADDNLRIQSRRLPESEKDVLLMLREEVSHFYDSYNKR